MKSLFLVSNLFLVLNIILSKNVWTLEPILTLHNDITETAKNLNRSNIQDDNNIYVATMKITPNKNLEEVQGENKQLSNDDTQNSKSDEQKKLIATLDTNISETSKRAYNNIDKEIVSNSLIKDEDETLINKQNFEKEHVNISDELKEQIITQYLLKEMQNPTTPSENVQQYEKQKVIRLLLNVLNNPEGDTKQTEDNKLSENPKEIKRDENEMTLLQEENKKPHTKLDELNNIENIVPLNLDDQENDEHLKAKHSKNNVDLTNLGNHDINIKAMLIDRDNLKNIGSDKGNEYVSKRRNTEEKQIIEIKNPEQNLPEKSRQIDNTTETNITNSSPLISTLNDMHSKPENISDNKEKLMPDSTETGFKLNKNPSRKIESKDVDTNSISELQKFTNNNDDQNRNPTSNLDENEKLSNPKQDKDEINDNIIPTSLVDTDTEKNPIPLAKNETISPSDSSPDNLTSIEKNINIKIDDDGGDQYSMKDKDLELENNSNQKNKNKAEDMKIGNPRKDDTVSPPSSDLKNMEEQNVKAKEDLIGGNYPENKDIGNNDDLSLKRNQDEKQSEMNKDLIFPNSLNSNKETGEETKFDVNDFSKRDNHQNNFTTQNFPEVFQQVGNKSGTKISAESPLISMLLGKKLEEVHSISQDISDADDNASLVPDLAKEELKSSKGLSGNVISKDFAARPFSELKKITNSNGDQNSLASKSENKSLNPKQDKSKTNSSNNPFSIVNVEKNPDIQENNLPSSTHSDKLTDGEKEIRDKNNDGILNADQEKEVLLGSNSKTQNKDTVDTVEDERIIVPKEDDNVSSPNENAQQGSNTDLSPMESEKQQQQQEINGDELQVQPTLNVPINDSNVGKTENELLNEIESKRALFNFPKPEEFLVAVPNNLNSVPDNKTLKRTTKDSSQKPDFTVDQIQLMSDQDIITQLRETQRIDPDMVKKSSDPEAMHEMLSSLQRIPYIETNPLEVEVGPTETDVGNISDSQVNSSHFVLPISELLTSNPFSVDQPADAPVDPRVLKSMNDAELQVALIALLSSMNPTETNQITLRPTGYGTFLTYIGGVDLNIDLVPVQTNALTRKKASKYFKEISKAVKHIHSKLPPGTDDVVKAVISATVPGGSEAIVAGEFIASVIKQQNEKKKKEKDH